VIFGVSKIIFFFFCNVSAFFMTFSFCRNVKLFRRVNVLTQTAQLMSCEILIGHFRMVSAGVSVIFHFLHPAIRQQDVVMSFGVLTVALLFVAEIVAHLRIPYLVAEGVPGRVLVLKNDEKSTGC
jgi:hypothetical protein